MSKLFKQMMKRHPKTATNNTDTVGEVKGFIDTGVYILNALLSGSIFKGFPNNKIVVFAGESSTGKTFYALSILKYFLDSDPKAKVIIWDTEGDIRNSEMKKRGLDTERILVIGIESVEEFGTSVKNAIDTYVNEDGSGYPIFFLLDSLGMLGSNKEIADMTEGKDVADMTRAKAIRKIFRVITFRLAVAQIPFLVTNHVYSGIMYSGKTMGGGTSSKYASSLVLHLSKKAEKDSAKSTIGGLISVKSDKSRLSKEGQTVTTLLMHKTGLDRYFGLHILALKYGIFKKSGKDYVLPDGTKVSKKNLLSKPEEYYTQEILEAIDKVCAKEFEYGIMDDDATMTEVLSEIDEDDGESVEE